MGSGASVDANGEDEQCPIRRTQIDDKAVFELAHSPEIEETTAQLMRNPFNPNAKLTAEVLSASQECWELITSGKCLKYKTISEDASNASKNCLDWFVKKYVEFEYIYAYYYMNILRYVTYTAYNSIMLLML